MEIEGNVPKFDLPKDFFVGDNITGEILNLYGLFPCKIKAGIYAFCRRGTIRATINLKEHIIKPNDFITLLPNSFIQIHEVSNDGLVCFAGFSSGFLESINFIKTISNSLIEIMDHPVIGLDDYQSDVFKDLFSLLVKMEDQKCADLFEGCTKSFLNIFLQSMMNMYAGAGSWEMPKLIREKEIVREFYQLVWQNYTKERGASFYAEKLRITLPHFCYVVKRVTGVTPLDVIANAIIMDAKAQLKSTNLPVKEIAINLGYTNVAFFDKYFKRYVGSTPLEYRNS